MLFGFRWRSGLCAVAGLSAAHISLSFYKLSLVTGPRLLAVLCLPRLLFACALLSSAALVLCHKCVAGRVWCCPCRGIPALQTLPIACPGLIGRVRRTVDVEDVEGRLDQQGFVGWIEVPGNGLVT